MYQNLSVSTCASKTVRRGTTGEKRLRGRLRVDHGVRRENATGGSTIQPAPKVRVNILAIDSF